MKKGASMRYMIAALTMICSVFFMTGTVSDAASYSDPDPLRYSSEFCRESVNSGSYSGLATMTHTAVTGTSSVEYSGCTPAQIMSFYESDFTDSIVMMSGGPVTSGSAVYPIDMETGARQPFDSLSHHTKSYSSRQISIGCWHGVGTARETKAMWAAMFGITGAVGSDTAHYAPDRSNNSFGIASASCSEGYTCDRAYPDSNADYWAVFKGVHFTDIAIESFFPCYFEDCVFDHCFIDSRSHNDLVFSGCVFNGGFAGNNGYNVAGETCHSVLHTSGGKNIVLSGCRINGGNIDGNLSSFILTNCANVYMYDTVVDASWSKDVITVYNDVYFAGEGSVRVFSGDYCGHRDGAGQAHNVFIRNIGVNTAQIKGGNIHDFETAFLLEKGAKGEISYPSDEKDAANGIWANDHGSRLISGSSLTVSGGYIGENICDGIRSTESKVEITKGHIRSSPDGIRLINANAFISDEALISENNCGIYAEGEGSIASVLGGAITQNAYGIYLDDGAAVISGGVIGSYATDTKAYDTNDIGVYHKGRLSFANNGRVEDRARMKAVYDENFANPQKNTIFLADESRYIQLAADTVVDPNVYGGSLGQIDIPRDADGRPKVEGAHLGRILYYVNGGEASNYKEAFTLADGIESYNDAADIEATNQDGEGSGWHRALIDAGNGDASAEGNVRDPFDQNYSAYGVLSGWHKANFSKEDGGNIYVAGSLAASKLLAGVLNDRVGLRVTRNNTEYPYQEFVWRSEYDAIGDGEGHGYYSAEMYYLDGVHVGKKVPYLKHTGWTRGTDDGADPGGDGLPSQYSATEVSAIVGLATDHNFDWCPVFSFDFDIQFSGNEYEYVDHMKDPPLSHGRKKGTVRTDDEGLLPPGSKETLNEDRSAFRVHYTSESTDMVYPEYCFDIQFFIPEEERSYYDKGKDKYVDHYTEFSQVGWSYDTDRKYDSDDLIHKGDVFASEGAEKLLEDLIANEKASVDDEPFTITVYAILDEAPDIYAYDRYYTSAEIQSMDVDEFSESLISVYDPITHEELIVTHDKEDGSFTGRDDDKVIVELLNFNQNRQEYRQSEFERDFKNIANRDDPTSPDMGGASVTYRVTDRAGNTTYYSIMVYVTSSDDLKSKSRWLEDPSDPDRFSDLVGYVPGAPRKLYVRFIDEWNYKKNPFWDRALYYDTFAYTADEFKTAWNAYQNGAEQPYSKWYTNAALVRKITDGFEVLRTADSYDDYKCSYTLTWDDMKDVQRFIASHGFGKTRSGSALSDFTAFLDSHKTSSELEIHNDGRHHNEMVVHAAESKKDPTGIYVMGYPPEWMQNDDWTKGKYVKH